MVLPLPNPPLAKERELETGNRFPPLQGGTKGGNFPALQEGGKYKGN
ncbi:hypothetical protein [Dolichospermum circinale]|nr:hypothetical protein [Dolichospermum circinale]